MTDPGPQQKRSWTRAADVRSLLVVAAAALVACAPIFAFGYPRGHDWIFGLVRVVEYREALASGQLPPLWVLHQYHGVGGLLFLFYGHGFLALSSLVGLVVGAPIPTASTTLVITSLIAGAGAYAWGRGAFGPGAPARLTGLAFALGPYVACNRLLRTSNAELMAMCLMPIALAGVAWIGRRPRAGFLALSLGLGAAVASHNMVALYGVGAVVVCALAAHARDRSTLLRSAVATATGLAIAAFYWVPAFALKDTINAAAAGTYFAVTDSFLPPAEWGGDAFYALGWPLIAAVGAAGIIVGRWGNANERTWAAAGTAACVLALWMTHASSAFVWTNAPLLPYFQFTWRIFGLFSLGAPIVLGAAVATAGRHSVRRRHALEILLAAACAVSFVPIARQTVPIDPELRPQVVADLNPEALRRRGLSATVGDQFVPAGADLPAVAAMRRGPGDIVAADGAIDVAIDAATPERLSYGVRGEGGTLTVARWAYPTWEVRVDGAVVTAGASSEGLLTVEVPAGEHMVEIALVQPPVRRAANAVSLLALLAALLVARWLPAER